MSITKRVTQTLLLSLLAATLAVTTAHAAPQVSALDGAGDLYEAHIATIGDLFPEVAEADRNNTGLVLKVTRIGEPTQWLLVPGTIGPEVESTPFLLAEGKTVHLVWESRKNFIHSHIFLASLTAGSWSDVIEISGEVFSQKSAPRIAVTRDSYEEVDPDSGEVQVQHLTTFHTVWFEDASSGRQAVYSPVQLRNGVYDSPNHVFVLGTFDPSEANVLPAPVDRLLEAPIVVSGRDSQHAVAAFADLATGRLAAVELGFVPQAIVELAEKVRANITDTGLRRKTEIATAVMDQILAEGRQVHPDFLAYIAQAAYELILGSEEGIANADLGQKVRANITDTGARMALFHKSDFTSANPAQFIEIPAVDPEAAPRLLVVRLASSRPAPQIGPGQVTLYPSPNGADLTVSWVRKDLVFYVESNGDGWSEVRKLQLGDGLDLSQAQLLLERRGRSR